MRNVKIVYETTMVNTGGRTGESSAPDKSFSVQVAPPNAHVAGATNPEQLFAAGYAACFNSALALVMHNEGIQTSSTVSATVSLGSGGPGDFTLGVVMEGHIENVPIEKAQELLEKAHTVCPYSKATKGNIDVVVKAV